MVVKEIAKHETDMRILSVTYCDTRPWPIMVCVEEKKDNIALCAGMEVADWREFVAQIAASDA